MGLTDKVAAALPATDYRARECMDTRRCQLRHDGKAYCLLSVPDKYVYCPLQGTEQGGRDHLFECLLQKYLDELNERNFGRRDRK